MNFEEGLQILDAQALNAWVNSDFQDESHFLRGQTLSPADCPAVNPSGDL